MNSLLYYYNNVQKMAAYRQAKRMQRGVKLGYRENPGLDTTTKFTIQDIPIGTTDFTLEWYGNSYGSDNGPNYFINKPGGGLSVGGIKDNNGIGYCGLGNIGSTNWKADDIDEKFHMCLIRKGQTIKLYANNSLIVKENVEIVDFGNPKIYLANSSDLGFFRVWNYALSADEIATLYNNGDPMGYVVPKESRYFEKRYQSDFADGTDGWGSVNGSPNLSVVSNGGILELSGNYDAYQIMRTVGDAPKYASKYKVRIELEERISLSSFLFYPFSTTTFVVGSFSEPTDVLEGVTNKPSDILSRNCYLYIYRLKPNDLVRIKSISVEPIGLIAEYLPQNLMYSKDDKAIATSWLDSAKQMPLSDEYMEPLFQSIGGYDMAANGAPEILYNE